MTEETFEDNIIEEDYDDDLDSEESEVHIYTDEEVDHIADTAIAAIQDILKYFNVGEVTIDEYEGDEEELIFKVGFVMEGWANESLRLNQVHGVDQVFTIEGNRKRMANSTNF